MTEPTHKQQLQGMLFALWERSRHTVVERAALLQAAGHQWAQGSLDEATRLSAVDSAHKLAGILGSFGLPLGTDLAREAEVFFGQQALPDRAELDHLQILLADLALMIETGPAKPTTCVQ